MKFERNVLNALLGLCLGVWVVASAGKAYAEGTSAPPQISYLSPVSEVTWTEGELALPIQATVGSAKVTGVRIVGAAQEAGKNLLQVESRLCGSRSGNCAGQALELSGPAVHELWLRFPQAEMPGSGTYKGSYRLIADGKVDLPPFQLTINVSSAGRMWAGVAVLTLGTFLGLFLAHGLRYRAEQLARMRPVAVIREELARAERDLAASGVDKTLAPRIHQEIVDVRKIVSDEALSRLGVNRGSFRFFFQDITSIDEANFKSAIEEAAKRVSGLRILLGGVGVAAQHLKNPQTRPAATAAIKSMDGLATALATTDASTLAKGVSDALDTMRAAIEALVRPAGALSVGLSPVPTVAQIDFTLAGINRFAWALFAILAVLVGTYVLILSRSAFGSPQDYVACLLWGFGLPTSGTALSALDLPAMRNTLSVATIRS